MNDFYLKTGPLVVYLFVFTTAGRFGITRPLFVAAVVVVFSCWFIYRVGGGMAQQRGDCVVSWAPFCRAHSRPTSYVCVSAARVCVWPYYQPTILHAQDGRTTCTGWPKPKLDGADVYGRRCRVNWGSVRKQQRAQSVDGEPTRVSTSDSSDSLRPLVHYD